MPDKDMGLLYPSRRLAFNNKRHISHFGQFSPLAARKGDGKKSLPFGGCYGSQDVQGFAARTDSHQDVALDTDGLDLFCEDVIK